MDKKRYINNLTFNIVIKISNNKKESLFYKANMFVMT